MKKIITLLLVGLMIFSSSIAVFAEEPGDGSPKLRIVKLKEFADEIHQINALRIERNQLQTQKIERQDQLLDLYIEAAEAGDTEALKAAKEERQKIKAIHEEIRILHEQAGEARNAFREAVKSKDIETAGAELEKLIDILSSINDKIKEKIEVLDAIIGILS